MLIYIILPLVGGLIGYLTNDLAVRMLFRPRNKIKVVFFTVQGVFPKQREKLALSLGDMISEKFINSDRLKELLLGEDEEEELENFLKTEIDRYLYKRIREKRTGWRSLVSDKMIVQLSDFLMKEVTIIIPQIIRRFESKLTGIDIRQMVYDRVMAVPPEELEEMLLSVMKKEMSTIKWIGGLIGLLVGLIQVLLLYLLQ